jgi:hypothetical protein
MRPRSESARSGSERAADRSLTAASLVQAGGTLTVHLLPLLVYLVAVAWGVSALAAGSLAAALSVGQLAATLLLPALFASLPIPALVAAGGALLCASLALIGAADTPGHAAWATAGLGSGTLIFASAKTVACDSRPVLAFSSRLGASLAVGGLATLALGLLRDHVGVRDRFWALSGVIGALTVSALLIAPAERQRIEVRAAPRVRAPLTPELLVGMALFCALFAGQVGTIVMLVRRVVSSGVDLSDVVFVMAGCKLVAAVFVVAAARRGKATAYVRSTAVLLAATVGAMSVAGDVVTLAVALLFWELCLNRLSAVMQGTLARLSPAATGAWSSALLLGGAAAGPMLHGAALDHGLGAVFVAFAMATAVAAGLWSSSRAAAAPAG